MHAHAPHSMQHLVTAGWVRVHLTAMVSMSCSDAQRSDIGSIA